MASRFAKQSEMLRKGEAMEVEKRQSLPMLSHGYNAFAYGILNKVSLAVNIQLIH